MILTWLVGAALTIMTPLSAKADDTVFEAYHVKLSRIVRHAPLRLDSARSRRYRTELTDIADGDIDYAGRYIMAEIGCGAACIEVAAIDTVTGHVVWLPATVSNWPKGITEPLEYRPDSSLMVVHGQLSERGSTGPHRFTLDRGIFKAPPR